MLVAYVPETGEIFWRTRSREWFTTERACSAWNGRFAGKEAGTISRMGYSHLSVAGRFFQAHRLIWLLMTGSGAPAEIDHINGMKSDNRWSNLRAVSHAENGRNLAMAANNTSGVTGVGWNARFGKWQARIRIAGRSKSLGYFDSLEDAATARKSADERYGFHPNHGNQR